MAIEEYLTVARLEQHHNQLLINQLVPAPPSTQKARLTAMAEEPAQQLPRVCLSVANRSFKKLLYEDTTSFWAEQTEYVEQILIW